MSSLQKALYEEVDKLPETILRRILQRKLSEGSLDIPAAAFDALVEHILNGGDETFSWEDPEGEDSSDFQHFELSFDEEDTAEVKASYSAFVSALPDLIRRVVKESGELMFKDLQERWHLEGAVQEVEVGEFCERLEERWGRGLDLLRMLLTCCRELGDEAHKRYRRSKAKKYAFRRFVLTRLQARACQVAEEVITLMENGLADGAIGRWRTLHEISVVATLIEDGDELLAERYIAHNAVALKRQADDYDGSLVPLGYKPISKRNRRDIEKEYEEAIKQYGSTFASPYGWASERLNTKKPTFKDIQEEAGKSGMSSEYKAASFNVHAGPRAMFYRLTDMGRDDVIFAGRCNAGLVEPGQNTAYNLVEVTSLLLGRSPNLDRQIEIQTLIEIRDAIPPALERADRRLRRDEATYQRGREKQKPR